jgi:hypothetical protein
MHVYFYISYFSGTQHTPIQPPLISPAHILTFLQWNVHASTAQQTEGNAFSSREGYRFECHDPTGTFRLGERWCKSQNTVGHGHSELPAALLAPIVGSLLPDLKTSLVVCSGYCRHRRRLKHVIISRRGSETRRLLVPRGGTCAWGPG